MSIFNAKCLSLLVFAILAGSLSAREVTISNKTPNPWALVEELDPAVMAADLATRSTSEPKVHYIEAYSDLIFNMESPGTFRYTLNDFARRSMCTLLLERRTNPSGGEDASTIRIEPEFGEEDCVHQVIASVSPWEVRITAPSFPALQPPPPRRLSQFDQYRHTQREWQRNRPASGLQVQTSCDLTAVSGWGGTYSMPISPMGTSVATSSAFSD